MRSIEDKNLNTLNEVDKYMNNPNEIDSQVDRILRGSSSVQNMLQSEYQSRIQSIEQCLTSRSNFLALFQQMLLDELDENKD